MKDSPTLADACAATLYDRSLPPGMFKVWNEILKAIVSANKFVLDDTMSAYLADLVVGAWKGGLRKRVNSAHNARRQARLPHADTWIEFDNSVFMDRYRRQGRHAMTFENRAGVFRPDEKLPDNAVPFRIGWLLRQHSVIDTAFQMIEVRTSTMKKDRVFIAPAAIAWSSDDGPIPWPCLDIKYGSSLSEAATHFQGFISDRVYPIEAHPRGLEMVNINIDLLGSGQTITPITHSWLLLATINDLPISVERIQPSKGCMRRGSYKKFLKHSVIHLNVPETRWHKLVLKTSQIIRKRAHQVRGHYRKDWRRPLLLTCEHIFDDSVTCKLCGGHKIFVHEHQRGDASLGFVTHDYEVHHD